MDDGSILQASHYYILIKIVPNWNGELGKSLSRFLLSSHFYVDNFKVYPLFLIIFAKSLFTITIQQFADEYHTMTSAALLLFHSVCSLVSGAYYQFDFNLGTSSSNKLKKFFLWVSLESYFCCELTIYFVIVTLHITLLLTEIYKMPFVITLLRIGCIKKLYTESEIDWYQFQIMNFNVEVRGWGQQIQKFIFSVCSIFHWINVQVVIWCSTICYWKIDYLWLTFHRSNLKFTFDDTINHKFSYTVLLPPQREASVSLSIWTLFQYYACIITIHEGCWV